ncbi:MAG: methionine--tRNA ligase [Gammaproteobacteria bacterium]|nr:methionine--tRNA ligase [Gammaproteobacteria bacterium]
MNTSARRILITNALPYANGPIHIGHLVGYIQADIWVRFQRMCGHEVHYVCADDTHGTPIMLRAESEGITPEALIDRVHGEHVRDFRDFQVCFDNFHSTHSAETRSHCEAIYAELNKAGLIVKRDVEQFYDPVKQMFLPDRYIRGECPKCHARDQYGDSCEVCGTTYAPTDLINPYSSVSGATPERRSSEHYFFALSSPQCIEFLQQWTRSGTLQSEAANKMAEWFGAGLQDWDISRDAPYFGFPIPGTDGAKYFYVWLDAPIGYIGSFENYCAREGVNFDEFWRAGHNTELHHFIGKDILYFHALFWPAMLEYSGYRTPSQLAVNGFLTVNGEKMSKSRGTFITAESYIKLGLNPEWLRYYFAVKSNGTMEDVDLNFDDFIARVNSDLVGKFVNIASRCAGFIERNFDGRVQNPELWRQDDVLRDIRARANDIAGWYDTRDFARALRAVMECADALNRLVDAEKPWELVKQEGTTERLHSVCSRALEGFRLLALYLKPVLPATAQAVEELLGLSPMTWADVDKHLSPEQRIVRFKHLMTRVDARQTTALVEANLATLAKPTAAAANAGSQGADAKVVKPKQKTNTESAGEHISIDDFMRVDLRVALVKSAELVDGSDKLLRLVVDAGGEERQIFAGIRQHYAPEQLVGRNVVIVANLAPRKMRFGVSEGMVLAAGDGEGLFVLGVDQGASPGMRAR